MITAHHGRCRAASSDPRTRRQPLMLTLLLTIGTAASSTSTPTASDSTDRQLPRFYPAPLTDNQRQRRKATAKPSSTARPHSAG
jgi:hypothetical protein